MKVKAPTRMLLATTALAVVGVMVAGPANAAEPGTIPYLSHGIGVDESQFSGQLQQPDKVAALAARNAERMDEAFAKAKSGTELLAEGSGTTTLQATAGLDPAIARAIENRADDVTAIPYLSHGIGVDESQFGGQASQTLSGPHAALQSNRHEQISVAPLPHGIGVELSPSNEQSLGLTGDSPLTRVSAPAPEGLTGDSAATRYPRQVPTATVSSGNDTDWTSFGAGAGLVALVAAGIAGVLLSMRRRHTVGLP